MLRIAGLTGSQARSLAAPESILRGTAKMDSLSEAVAWQFVTRQLISHNWVAPRNDSDKIKQLSVL